MHIHTVHQSEHDHHLSYQDQFRPQLKPLFLPFVQGIAEKIQHVCHPLGVKVVCSLRGKLREALLKPTPELRRKGAVYEVPCSECDHVYIGETGRTLEKRLNEYRSAVRKNDRKNGIAVHAWDKGHQVKWESAKVKEVETNLANRRIMEALHMQRLPHTTNLDCGLTIDPVWFPLLS